MPLDLGYMTAERFSSFREAAHGGFVRTVQCLPADLYTHVAASVKGILTWTSIKDLENEVRFNTSHSVKMHCLIIDRALQSTCL